LRWFNALMCHFYSLLSTSPPTPHLEFLEVVRYFQTLLADAYIGLRWSTSVEVLNGDKFPTLQHEQMRSGCSITLSSGNRICIFSCSAFNFCRFHVELKMPQCLIFTKRLGRMCSAKRLINSSWVRVICFFTAPLL